MAYTSRFDVPGSELTTLAAGGRVAEVIDVSNSAELVEALSDKPGAICIGGGSNLLIADEGMAGALIRAWVNSPSLTLPPTEEIVTVDATADWDAFVAATVDANRLGLESTSGIPGSVGGAVVQNAGAYGQEIADVVVRVHAWDREARTAVRFDREKCEFSYRTSRFKHDDTRRYVITSVEMQLSVGDVSTPRYGDVARLLNQQHSHDGPYLLSAIRNAVLQVRSSKGMVLGASLPSAGSFFTNPEVTKEQSVELAAAGINVNERSDGLRLASAAALMEAAGFTRGYVKGRAGLSQLHGLAIVNLGGATTNDILELAAEVSDAVVKRFGILLVREPVLLGK